MVKKPMRDNKNHPDILSIADSPHQQAIKQFINRISAKEIFIHAAFNMNVATLLATFLLGFGLAIDTALHYIFTAYIIIGLGVLVKLWLAKQQPNVIAKVPLFEVVDDLVFLCAVPIVFFSTQDIDILLAIYFVLCGLFVTSFFTVKYLHNYLIAKALVFCFCIVFVSRNQSEYLSFIYTIFSLATIYILLVCLACWIHIRQIRLYHLNAANIDLYQKAEWVNENLNTLKQQRDKLMRHIGHDLRQPIIAINYALLNIQTSPLNTMQKSQIDNALASVNDANTMLEEVLKLAIDEGANALSKIDKPFIISDLLTMLYKEYQGLALQKGCSLRMSSCSLALLSDEKLLARILRNFLSNAINYGNGCKILLGVRRRAAGLDIQVLDQGPGIPAELLNTIFEEYTRLSIEQHNKGTGLGLNVAQTIAATLGTKVSIQSEPDKGTICTLHIPDKLLHVKDEK